MTDTTPPDDAGRDQTPPVASWPLESSDPPRVGDFWLDARILATPSGIAYLAHEQAGTPAMVILLSEGAASDAAARARLSGQVNDLDIDTVIARGGQGQDDGRLAGKFRSELDDPLSTDGAPLAPWVALAYDGSPEAVHEASRILAEIDLSWLAQQGTPAGPDYELPWIDRTAPGLSRIWPLPWPGRRDRAGRTSILASWLLILLLTVVAVLIAILLFSQSPQAAPPPLPTSSPTGSPPPTGSPSPDSASPSPDSASPSPESASPSPGSASPSPGSASPSPGSASPSPGTASPSPGTGSPSGTATATAGSSPTQNSRL